MDQSALYSFLRHSRLGVLASVYEGTPQSALVGIAVTPQLEIIFDTVRNSRKYRNLHATSACSFVIGWSGEQTVQYDGEARELAPPALAVYQDIYFDAWPECRAHLTWPGITYFAVRPSWIRFSDFDQAPPAIVEFTF